MTASVEVFSPRRTVGVDSIGGGRAATDLVQQLAKMFSATDGVHAELALYDPAPGKARQRAREAEALGITARAVETTGQAALAAAGAIDRLVIINIDHAPSCAECLVLAAENDRPVVVTLFIQLPTGKLVALRAAFAAADRAGKLALAAFFVTLGRITVRAGSSKVWGPDAPPANILLERPMRDWFLDAFRRACDMAAGVPAEGAAVEITFDGEETMPLFIRDSREGWTDRQTLAREIAAQTSTPIDRGTSFAIAELGTEAIHLVPGKRRALDREIAIDTFEAIDAEGYEEAERRREEAAARRRAEIEESLRQAEQARLTPMNPVYVTD